MTRDLEIGVIGLGDMGKLYASQFCRLGYRVNGSDVPGRNDELRDSPDLKGVHVLDDGIAVSRRSDIVFYLVETRNIGEAVKAYGPSTKKGAIVSSGTSVMTPAIEAFDQYVPKDVSIINWHWLFGPSVKPEGSNSVVSIHRTDEESERKAREVFSELGMKVLEIPYQEHDRITADTQAVTHLGFQSMGTAWKNMGSYPWENTNYMTGIDNVKILMCLRLFDGKSHVYSGLAFFNPQAKEQIRQYRNSTIDLFGLMIREKEKELRQRLRDAEKNVFRNEGSPLLLDEKVLERFSLGIRQRKTPNSHLSLLAMADAWNQLGRSPYDNLVCQTPPFKLRVGIVEYLFRNPDLLEQAIQTAVYDKSIRADDLAFQNSVIDWSTMIMDGDEEGYMRHFEDVKRFFGEERLRHGKEKSGELIAALNS